MSEMVMMRRTVTLAIAMAATVAGAFPGSRLNHIQGDAPKLENSDQGHVELVTMRVSRLHAGADATEVERVLGRPTSSTLLDWSDGTNLACSATRKSQSRRM